YSHELLALSRAVGLSSHGVAEGLCGAAVLAGRQCAAATDGQRCQASTAQHAAAGNVPEVWVRGGVSALAEAGVAALVGAGAGRATRLEQQVHALDCHVIVLLLVGLASNKIGNGGDRQGRPE